MQSIARSKLLPRTRVRRVVSLLVACLAVPLVLTAIKLPFAAAADPGPLPGIVENGSDPMVTKCRYNGHMGYCMVTSQDVGSGASPTNPYPMNKTKGYFSADGLNWQDGAG